MLTNIGAPFRGNWMPVCVLSCAALVLFYDISGAMVEYRALHQESVWLEGLQYARSMRRQIESNMRKAPASPCVGIAPEVSPRGLEVRCDAGRIRISAGASPGVSVSSVGSAGPGGLLLAPRPLTSPSPSPSAHATWAWRCRAEGLDPRSVPHVCVR